MKFPWFGLFVAFSGFFMVGLTYVVAITIYAYAL